jgi:hypothetical protein
LGWEKLPSNGLAFSCRERAASESAKIATISRAKRSDCMRVLGGEAGFVSVQGLLT